MAPLVFKISLGGCKVPGGFDSLPSPPPPSPSVRSMALQGASRLRAMGWPIATRHDSLPSPPPPSPSVRSMALQVQRADVSMNLSPGVMRRTRLLCAIGVSLWSAVIVGSQAAAPVELSLELRAHVKGERFGIVTSIRGLPLGVRDRAADVVGQPGTRHR